MKKLTFADLSDKKTYLVTILDPDGEAWEVGLRALSQEEFLQINDSVPEPQSPTVNVKGRTVQLTDDATYRKQVLEAQRERTYRWLAAMLADMDIPGATLPEKSAALRAGGPASWIVAQVIDHAQRIMGLSVPAVAERAESFQSAAER